MLASDGLPVAVFAIRLSTSLTKPTSLPPTESVKTLIDRLPMICLTSAISADFKLFNGRDEISNFTLSKRGESSRPSRTTSRGSSR